VLVSVPRFFFLQMRCIRQKNPSQIHRCRRGIYRAIVALRDKARQISGVIDVRMRENNRIHRVRIDWRIFPVSQPQIFRALE